MNFIVKELGKKFVGAMVVTLGMYVADSGWKAGLSDIVDKKFEKVFKKNKEEA